MQSWRDRGACKPRPIYHPLTRHYLILPSSKPAFEPSPIRIVSPFCYAPLGFDFAPVIRLKFPRNILPHCYLRGPISSYNEGITWGLYLRWRKTILLKRRLPMGSSPERLMLTIRPFRFWTKHGNPYISLRNSTSKRWLIYVLELVKL